MEINRVTLVYFSPTGTTAKILESIARGITDGAVEQINLTPPAKGSQPATPSFSADELVILGAPVYGGRLPADAVARFKQLTAAGTLAVPVVLYGNREFEDALLELTDLAKALGFAPVAGGAFIGEHSFARTDLPIANGRPDSIDVQKAVDFGNRIKDKITGLDSADMKIDLEVPGRCPYKGGVKAMTVAPVTREDQCTLCGTCADLCPTGAISINEELTTQASLCIRCCACIKNCPEDARVWEDETMEKIAKWLNENCSTRKEPQIFGIDG